ncbi:MAG: MFS transporter [Nostoc sp.]|uniref:MFS transporter n=1 Tax=Nostoc sp. TaxID=1180 RepID=UPI002FF47998
MISTKSLQKLGLLGSLYMSQFIPTMFLFQALPVFMRQQGVSRQAIGLLSLLLLPSMLNFLWAPLLDRYSFTTVGHYRFWIICFQLLIACTTFAGGLLDIQHNFTALVICLFVMCFFCCLQNIATDALAVGLLDVNERGFGNGVQIGGSYLGAVIGGGLMLSLLNYWGWKATMFTLALLVVMALLPILWHKEPKRNHQSGAESQRLTLAWKNLVQFFRRPGIWRWLLILVLYLKGSAIAGTMYRPFLVDIGLSLGEIGFLLGVVSYSTGVFAALTAGLLINPLGRKRSLILFGLLQAVAIAIYLLPAFGVKSLPVLYLAAIAVQFSTSMASTTISTIMMDKSELATAGTDYSIQGSVASFSGIAAAAISGVIAEALGYRGVFAISVAIAVLGVAIIAIAFNDTRSTQDSALTTQ